MMVITMIVFWNQKEVYNGYSLEKLNDVRSTLAANNIKYKYRTVIRNNFARRGRTGSLGLNLNYSNLYYVYVHKRDYNKACAVLRNT